MPGQTTFILRLGCGALGEQTDEANALLATAQMPPLFSGQPAEAALLGRLRPGESSPGITVAPSPSSNLPAQLTRFIGREHEIAEIKRLMNANRLVTVTGSRGVGKTRQAIDVEISLVGAYGPADYIMFEHEAASNTRSFGLRYLQRA